KRDTSTNPRPTRFPRPSLWRGGSRKPGSGRPKCVRVRRMTDLQVRLEVAVIANLLVDLQPVPLAVGNDDLIACRIKLHRCREAETPLRFEASYPTTRLRHIGIGIDGLLPPLRQNLRIADQVADRLALGIENRDAVVAPI